MTTYLPVFDAGVHPGVGGKEDEDPVGHLLLNLEDGHPQGGQVLGVAAVGEGGQELRAVGPIRQNLTDRKA